eukprot:7988911-Alexandrium_andersonii.AAC.1
MSPASSNIGAGKSPSPRRRRAKACNPATRRSCASALSAKQTPPCRGRTCASKPSCSNRASSSSSARRSPPPCWSIHALHFRPGRTRAAPEFSAPRQE